MNASLEEIRNLRVVAKNYHALMSLVLGSWFGMFLLSTLTSPGPGETVSSAAVALQTLVGAAFALALAFLGYRLASSMGSKVPWLWGIGMMIPLLNLIFLLALSRRCTALCKHFKVRVGLMGPNLHDISLLEQFIVAPPAGYTSSPRDD